MLAAGSGNCAYRRAGINSEESRLAIDVCPNEKVILAGAFERQRLEGRALETDFGIRFRFVGRESRALHEPNPQRAEQEETKSHCPEDSTSPRRHGMNSPQCSARSEL